MNLFTTRPQDAATDANSQQFLMHQFLMGKAFINLALVVDVKPSEDDEDDVVFVVVEGVVVVEAVVVVDGDVVVVEIVVVDYNLQDNFDSS